MFFISLALISVVPVNAELSDYPYQPVTFRQVHFNDSFWLGRMETNRTVTIPFAFKKCEDTGRIENFKLAGGLSNQPYQGKTGFNDSDVYKIMEAAAYSLMLKPDPQMDAYLDKVISYVAAAQEENGYLYTAWTSRAQEANNHKMGCCYKKEPWDNLHRSHELYNVGHMYEAAAAHYLATGKKTFLNVAIKNADLVCDVFGPGKRDGFPGHQEIEIGLVKLYRVTGEKKYLDQAQRFLDCRGSDPQNQREYDQSHIPVTEQFEAVGHAVRGTYMYSGMADVAALTDNQKFIQAIDKIWDDVANRKLYITGGIGARHHGESYGDPYELPNQTAYCETCAVIANVYWNHRMFLLHGDSKYVDIMERALYNNVLSGVSMDGMTFFYPNPLEAVAGQERSPWFNTACCPSNICRFLNSMPGYVYAVRDRQVYVNLFIGSRSEFDVDGTALKLTQNTQYPWNGKILINVDPQEEKTFTLKIRVPDWAQGWRSSSALYTFVEPLADNYTILLNGKVCEVVEEKGYACLKKSWKKGDVVEVEFSMPVRRVLCDRRVADNVGKIAVQRGPVVYCLEQQDLEGGNPLNIMIENNSELTADYDEEFLGGMVLLRGHAIELQKEKSQDVKRTKRNFKMIPYYARAHRGKQPMVVWIPYIELHARPLPVPTIASESTVSTSFISDVGINDLEAVHDQKMPASSSDKAYEYLHWGELKKL